MNEDPAAIVRDALGCTPDHTEPIETGQITPTYRVSLEEERYILQIAPADEAEGLARTLGCYRLFAASPVPVPTLVTEQVRTVEEVACILLEECPGESAQLAVSPARSRAAGQYLARIHDAQAFERAGTITFEGESPVVDPLDAATYRAHRRKQGLDAATSLRENGLQRAGDAVAACIDRHIGVVPASINPVLCHGDFSPDNVLFEGSTVTGIVDFDRAHAGDPRWDLVRAATAFWLHDPGPESRLREVCYSGYALERQLKPTFDRLEAIYRVTALARAVVGLITSRGLETDEQAFYEEQLLAAVERAERVLSRG